MFALFEDDFPHSWGPQASLPSAAQPAVMDIRRLRRRLLEIPYHKCESSEIKKIVSIVSIVFKNNASGWPFPFHIKKIVSIVSIVFKNNASEKLKKYCL